MRRPNLDRMRRQLRRGVHVIEFTVALDDPNPEATMHRETATVTARLDHQPGDRFMVTMGDPEPFERPTHRRVWVEVDRTPPRPPSRIEGYEVVCTRADVAG